MMKLDKLLIIVLLWCTAPTIHSKTASELKAFTEFLEKNINLKQAIIILDNTTDTTNFQTELNNLIGNYRSRIFKLPALNLEEEKAEKYKKFGFIELFYFGSHRIGVFVPQMLSNEMHEYIFEVASDHGLFNNSIAWFVVSKEMDNFRSKTNEIFGNLNMHVNADITLAVETWDSNNSSSYTLYDIYKKCRYCPHVEIEPKGKWCAAVGMQLLPKFKQSFVRRRINLNRTIVRVGTTLLKKPPGLNYLTYLVNSEDNLHSDIMQRKSFRLFQDLERLYNMTFNISYTTAFGEPLSARAWTGLLGALATETFEFSVAPMRLTLERLTHFKFTPQFHIEDINMLLRHPRRNTVRNIFISPLDSTVWWSTLAIIILIIFLMSKHIRLEKKQQQHTARRSNELSNQQPPAALETRFDYIVLIILESIFHQGPDSNIFVMFSTRLLIFTSGVFSVILMQYYGAFIVGSLLAEEPRTITTPQALYDSNFDIGMENVTYNFDIFNKTADPISLSIFNERICKNKLNTLLTLQKGAERIKQGHFAFQTNTPGLYRLLLSSLTEAEFCDLQEIYISEPFAIASAITKNCSFNEYLAQGIITYRTIGLLDYNNIHWEVPKPDCNLIKNDEVEVDLKHFAPALVFLSFAIIVAFLVFLLELAYYRWQKLATRYIGLRKFCKTT